MRITAFASLAVFALACPAYSADPPAVITIGREAIKEGHSAAHEKTEADWARAMRKANWPYHFFALTSMSGPGEMWCVTEYDSFADVERADKQLETAALKADYDALAAHDAEHRLSSRPLIAVFRSDLSLHPEYEILGKTHYVAITMMRVKAGRMPDFLAGSKVYQSAYEKSNFPLPMLAYEVISGARAGLVLFIMPMESLKSMDDMPQLEIAMIEAMGPDTFEKLEKGSGDVLHNTELKLFRVNPAMSYVSKETEDADPSFWRPKPAAK